MGITFELDMSHLMAFLFGMAFCYFLMTYRRKPPSKPSPPNANQIHTQLAQSSNKITSPTSSAEMPLPNNAPQLITTPPDTTTPSVNRRASLSRSNSSPMLPKKSDQEKDKEKERDDIDRPTTPIAKRLDPDSARTGRRRANSDEKHLGGSSPSPRTKLKMLGKSAQSLEDVIPYERRAQSPLRHTDRNKVIPKRDTSFFSDSNIDWEELKIAIAHPVTGVEIRELKKKLGKNKKCFSGSDACDWLEAHVEGGIDRKKAVDIGVKLWASGLFRHVSHRYRPFCDGSNEYFRFLKKKEKESLKEEKEKEKLSGGKGKASKSMSEDKDDDQLLQTLGDLGAALEKNEAWLDIQQSEGWVRRWCEMQGETKQSEKSDEGQVLNIFDQITDKAITSLIQHMTAPGSGLKIKSRRYLLKTYSKCFVGKRAVDWLVSNRPECATRRHAIALMNKLMQKGLLSDVANDKFVFKDNSNWYTFNLSEEEGSSQGVLLGQIPLNSQILFKLKKKGSYVFIILYHAENKPIVRTKEEGLALGLGLSKTSASKKQQQQQQQNVNSLNLDDFKNFVIRLHEKDEANLKHWIFAFQAAVLLAIDESPLESTEIFDSDESVSDEEFEEEEEVAPLTKEVLSSAEQAVLHEMKSVLEKEKSEGNGGSLIDYTQVPDMELIKFIRARKLELGPAIALLKAGVVYRRENNLELIKITDVVKVLRGGMLRLVPSARDKEGRVVLVILPQYYRPAEILPIDLVRTMYYLLDCALENDEQTQRTGFSVLVDCKDSKYANFDAKMPKVVLNGMVSKYPARVGHVIITNTPWFFRFIWGVIRPLLSEQLAAKFHIIPKEEIAQFIDEASLLPMHGGTSDYDHEEWIRSRFEKEGIPYVP